MNYNKCSNQNVYGMNMDDSADKRKRFHPEHLFLRSKMYSGSGAACTYNNYNRCANTELLTRAFAANCWKYHIHIEYQNQYRQSYSNQIIAKYGLLSGNCQSAHISSWRRQRLLMHSGYDPSQQPAYTIVWLFILNLVLTITTVSCGCYDVSNHLHLDTLFSSSFGQEKCVCVCWGGGGGGGGGGRGGLCISGHLYVDPLGGRWIFIILARYAESASASWRYHGFVIYHIFSIWCCFLLSKWKIYIQYHHKASVPTKPLWKKYTYF